MYKIQDTTIQCHSDTTREQHRPKQRTRYNRQRVQGGNGVMYTVEFYSKLLNKRVRKTFYNASDAKECMEKNKGVLVS